MNTWDVFGHDWAVEMLQKHVANDALRHAYLFTGSAGVGRRTLAMRLAQAINCTKPTSPAVPCLNCRTCRQIEAEHHPDLLVIRKAPDKKDIVIAQVREDILRFLSFKPYSAEYKIVVILGFEDANQNAQNALLKTLEEAPGYAVLILTAENVEQLLPTIVSRCEIMRLRPLPVDAVVDFLSTRGVEAEKSRLLAHLSEGRPGYALKLSADNGAELAFRSEKLDDLHTMLTSRIRDRFKYAEKLAKDKETFRKTLLLWLSFWRDVLLKTSGANADVTNVDRADEIASISSRLDLPQVRGISSLMEKAVDRLDRNINARLLAEATLLDLPRLN